MATRASTQKHEVYHVLSGQVVITGVSKTDANKFRIQMDAGRRGKFAVRPVRRVSEMMGAN